MEVYVLWKLLIQFMTLWVAKKLENVAVLTFLESIFQYFP